MKSATCTGTNGQYLEEYHSQAAAEIAAEERDGKFEVIRCRRCNWWHLTPLVSRKQCMFCTDSALFLKDIYATKEDALRTADHLWKEKKIKLLPYKCPHSSGWHLTKHR
jgi:hypothetical protein